MQLVVKVVTWCAAVLVSLMIASVVFIEGWELPALRGASEILTRHKPLVLCEFNPFCLREQGGIDPSEFADFVFATTGAVELVEQDGSRTTVSAASKLLELWSERDAYHSDRGDVAHGGLHFDLLFRPS